MTRFGLGLENEGHAARSLQMATDIARECFGHFYRWVETGRGKDAVTRFGLERKHEVT